MIPCTKCGTATPKPNYNLSTAQRLRRLCAECRAANARTHGRQARTQHYAIEPTPHAIQVVLGSALGDGGFERNSKTGPWRLAIKHSYAQHNYLRWKSSLLGALALNPTPCEGTKLRVRTRTHPLCSQVHDQLHGDLSTFEHMLSRMDLLAWAIFYLDDGSYAPEHKRPDGYMDHATVRISCPSFTQAERHAIGTRLATTFGVEWTTCTWSNPRDGDAPYHGIRLYREHALRFLAALAPLIPEESGMRYKIVA